MGEVNNQLIKLQDMSNFLETSNLEDNLLQLAKMTARILDAENCSIMLLNDGDSENPRMSICASHGKLPAVAYQESIGKNESIAGHVIATGKSLLIENISNSEFINQARRSNNPQKSLLCSPVKINMSIIGVVNISHPIKAEAFSLTDLNLLEIIALFIGKSIQAIQLQKILDSQFAQMAFSQRVRKNSNITTDNTLHNPDQVAKILAKTFFKEMSCMGLGSSQIILAASEIINQLNNNLQQYSNRTEKEAARILNKPL